MRQAGLRLYSTAIDSEGALVPQGIGAKLAVLTPNAQYPTGSVMSMQRREAWLHHSQQQQVWLIEDDYAAEYSYQQHPTPSLLTHPHAEQVIHIGTMSKLMLPDLRLGWIVVPKAIASEVCAAINTLGLQPAYSIQQQLALFMQYGYLGQHLVRTRAVYHERRRRCIEYLQRHARDLVRIVASISGMNLLLEVQFTLNPQLLIQALRADGLGFAIYTSYKPTKGSLVIFLALGHALLVESELELTLAKLLLVLCKLTNK